MSANQTDCTLMDLFSNIENTEREELLALRKELAEANYKYYVENAPTLSDYEFDQKLKRLEQLEKIYPDMYDATSPSQKVGSDLGKEVKRRSGERMWIIPSRLTQPKSCQRSLEMRRVCSNKTSTTKLCDAYLKSPAKRPISNC